MAKGDFTFINKKSDDYFVVNTEKFDVIFIDGLHKYEQVLKDFINAWNCLNIGGYIVIHDCNPLTKDIAAPEPIVNEWCGDVWKLIADINMNYKDIKAVVIDTDYGCGVVRKTFDTVLEIEINKEIEKLEYEYLEANRKEILNLITQEDFIIYAEVAIKQGENYVTA
jgi:hypothetical protein